MVYTHITEKLRSRSAIEKLPVIHWIIGKETETLACGQDIEKNEGSYLTTRVTCLECRRYAKQIVSVQIIPTHFSPGVVRFFTGFHLQNSMRGRVYRNVSDASWRRLARVLHEMALPCFYDHEQGTLTFGRKE